MYQQRPAQEDKALGTLTNTETNSYVEQYRVLHVKQKVMRDEIAEIDSKSKKIAFDLSTK